MMRRLGAAGVLVLCALVGTACSSGSGKSAAAGTPAVSPSASVSPSGSADPYAANTRQVCDSLNKVIAAGASTIGTDLGTAVGHLAGGNSSDADKAKAAALTHIKSLAASIRTTAQPAQAPRLQQAADGAAGNLEILAADPNLLAGLKSAADVNPVLEKVTGATGTLTHACV